MGRFVNTGISKLNPDSSKCASETQLEDIEYIIELNIPVEGYLKKPPVAGTGAPLCPLADYWPGKAVRWEKIMIKKGSPKGTALNERRSDNKKRSIPLRLLLVG